MRISRVTGRVQTVIASKLFGFAFMAAIIVGDGRYWGIQTLAATLQVMRTGLMNSSAVVMQSIMGDYTPKNTRGKWQAMDMITSFGWSGSSLFGAWMLDRFKGDHPYRTLFLIS